MFKAGIQYSTGTDIDAVRESILSQNTEIYVSEAGKITESLGDKDKGIVNIKGLVWKVAQERELYSDSVRNAVNAGAEDYNRLARFYIRNEQGEQAVEYLQKRIEKFPQSDLQDLYYNMVSAYESYGAYEDALDALKKYTRLYGEDDGAAREKAFLKERI